MTTTAGRHRLFILATCAALVLAAIGDAGPEIIESRSVLTGYDGPGPLIYLGFAVVVATVRWRYIPLTAVVMSLFFLFGGFADADFRTRLVTPTETIEFLAAWLQMLSFAATVLLGIAAVRWRAPADAEVASPR
ncbi:hypothetical protein F3087_05995 [Nocardia colli]|uniref:Uncharacterized protein n=1 Tax=Nocardia colli TaxID=2545717 RepID=A0A5N0ENT2_9NOCA|nr:hypothetical protein [Nocardia colli]KAA8890782.1 hypothetical protein F3087_05995 [Nocardia colli]